MRTGGSHNIAHWRRPLFVSDSVARSHVRASGISSRFCGTIVRRPRFSSAIRDRCCLDISLASRRSVVRRQISSCHVCVGATVRTRLPTNRYVGSLWRDDGCAATCYPAPTAGTCTTKSSRSACRRGEQQSDHRTILFRDCVHGGLDLVCASSGDVGAWSSWIGRHLRSILLWRALVAVHRVCSLGIARERRAQRAKTRQAIAHRRRDCRSTGKGVISTRSPSTARRFRCRVSVARDRDHCGITSLPAATHSPDLAGVAAPISRRLPYRVGERWPNTRSRSHMV